LPDFPDPRQAPNRPAEPSSQPAVTGREPRTLVRPGRVRYFYVTVVRRDTDQRLQGNPVNLNTGGMYVHCDAPFPPDAPVDLEACAHDERTEYRFRVRGRVAYRIEGGMGIQFEEPTPEALYLIRHIVKIFLSEAHHLADPSW